MADGQSLGATDTAHYPLVLRSLNCRFKLLKKKNKVSLGSPLSLRLFHNDEAIATELNE